MDRIQLSSNLSMSRVLHGYWRLNEWNLSKNELLHLIEEAASLGVTTIDHADIYGGFTCEEAFGDALALNPNLRSKLQLVTKCGIKFPCPKRPEFKSHIYDTSKEHIIASAENSLKNFNTDYLDLLLIHRPDPLMDPEVVAEAFNELKKSGKVLNFGVSNFLPHQYDMLNSYLDTPLVTNQIEVSPLNLDQFTNGTLDSALKNRIHPLVWSPLAGGAIFTRNDEKAINIRKILEKIKWETSANSIDEIVYAWLLAHPSKMLPIVGSHKIERLKAAVNATDINLSKDQWFEIYVTGMGQDIP